MTTAERSGWMLYGAYGTTGRLILDEAVRRDTGRSSPAVTRRGSRPSGAPPA